MSLPKSIIKFSTNWNQKLNCKHFTTLRISGKYEGANHLLVEFKGKYKVGRVIETRKLKLWSLNEFMCRLDTGYSLKETFDIIGKMYNFDPVRENRTIYLYLIQTDTDWITLPECHDILG